MDSCPNKMVENGSFPILYIKELFCFIISQISKDTFQRKWWKMVVYDNQETGEA
jgi:hypothetical protein